MLAEAGYDVTGIDLSDEMLAAADRRAREQGLAIRFSQQDIAEWRLEAPVDMAVCFCDSLNYLPSEEAFERFLRAAYEGLIPGGLLLFDIHAPRMFTEVFNGRTFTFNEEELAYIWDAAYDEKGRNAIHEMTFFQKKEGGLYRRFEEVHRQHLFLPADVLKGLERTGFAEITCSADFTLDPPAEGSERLFFAARKR